MKRTAKILLYLIVVFISLLAIFHDFLLNNLVKDILTEKSKGEIQLSSESFHLGLHYGTVSINKPVLVFKDLFLDEAKTIKIEKVGFNEVKIDRLDLISLIFKREIRAGRFLVSKPEFWIIGGGEEKKSEIHPEGFVKAMKRNKDAFSDFVINVDKIEIRYGSINLSQPLLLHNKTGKVDFTITIDSLTTYVDSITGKRVFNTEDMLFKIKGLHNVIREGYILNIDSALFSAKEKDLFVSGISVTPTLNNRMKKNTIGFNSRELIFHDLNLEKDIETKTLTLKSIVCKNGTFINYSNNRSEKKTGKKKDKEGFLKEILNDLDLDSIFVSDFNYLDISEKNDTLISVSDVGLLIKDIHVDSTMLTDIVKNVLFSDLSLSTGPLNIGKQLAGLTIDYDNLYFSGSKKKIKIQGINVNGGLQKQKIEKLDLGIPELTLSGLSVTDLQKGKKQNLTLNIKDPKGVVVFSKAAKDNNESSKKTSFPAKYNFEEISVENGAFSIKQDSDFNAEVTGLFLTLTGLFQEKDDSNIRFREISVYTKAVSLFLEKENINAGIGSMVYRSGNLLLDDINLDQNNTNGKSNLGIKSIRVAGLDRERLTGENEIVFDSLLVLSPVFSGDLIFREKDDNEKHAAFGDMVSPVYYSAQSLKIENGKIDVNLDIKNENVHLRTDYDLMLSALHADKNDSLKNVLKKLLWRFELKKLKADALNHNLSVSNILSVSDRPEVVVRDISVSPKKDINPDSTDIYIRSFKLPLFRLTGLDLSLLIDSDSIAFSTLQIENPDLDMVLSLKKDTAAEKNKDEVIDPEKYLIARYDSVLLRNGYGYVELKGTLKNNIIDLRGVDICHFNDSTKTGNLISDVVFKLDDLDFHNNINTHSVNIKKAYLDKENNTFYIESIKGKSKKNPVPDAPDKKQLGVDFRLDDVKMSDITISNALPSVINAGKLRVRNIDVNIVSDTTKKVRKEGFNIDPNILRKYENIFSLIELDTAQLDDVTFNMINVKDSANRALKIENIAITADQIKLDTSLTNILGSGLMHKITVDLKRKKVVTKDSLYEIYTGDVSYNFPDRTITVDSFYVNPLFEPDQFFEMSVFQTDRMDIFIHRIVLDNIRLEELITKDQLHIGEVNLTGVKADIYRDKHYQLKPGIHKKMIRESIMGIKKPFTIDSVHISDSYLRYREMSEKADEPGEVYFDDVNLSVSNITNRLKEGEKKDLILDMKGKIMGAAGFNVNVHFPLNPDTIAFLLTGKTDKLEMSLLNPLTTNLLGIGITKGKGSADIKHIEATNTVSHGYLIFRYQKLRLHPYSRKKEKLKKGPLAPILKFMINDLVVKSNNPKFARKPRVGQVYFERDPRKGIVNYLWKSILSGLMSTMGFNNRDQRKGKKEDKKNDNAVQNTALLSKESLQPQIQTELY